MAAPQDHINEADTDANDDNDVIKANPVIVFIVWSADQGKATHKPKLSRRLQTS